MDDLTDAYDRWTLQDDEKLDYGYGAKTGGRGIDDEGGFYITTAINYTNGPAHMGHAYEAVTTDALARFARLQGKPTYFVTGSDEHGQKIANTAADEGKEPIEICDKYVTGFSCLNQRILISNDDYIRTTSDRHKRTAKELWKRCADNDDIYLHHYTGWYNVREETFVTDSDAKLSDYKDPSTGLPLKQVEEESYFFKMSAYHDRLVQHIEENPDFIRPSEHRQYILKRLADDELRDLSISRTSFKWGIPVPEGFDDNHVMYVWLDALSNYLTGVDGLGIRKDSGDLSKFWPAQVHIIGKDILWFHTVIWPCLLMSAKVPLPKTVYAHGFVNDREGKKMSKSVGNVVDPQDMLDKYPVDIFRWYLCKEAPYGGELSFNEDSLRDMHNKDLCDTLGNLVQRATNLCQQHCDGLVPDVPAPPTLPIDLVSVCESYIKEMENFALESGASICIQGFRDVNGYLTREEPWKKKGEEHAQTRRIAVRASLEAIYALSHLLLPFVPIGATKIFRKLNTPPVSLAQLKTGQRNLAVGTNIEVGEILYSKLRSEDFPMTREEKAKIKAATCKKGVSYAEAMKKKKEKKAKAIALSRAGQQASDQPDFTKMDIRVGQITKVWLHPEADKLFCEEIDVGEETGPRQIASGLRGHYELEDMENQKVLVVCNLKASKIVGFSSSGMVLAAKSEDGSKVELVAPPDGASVGERVFIEGLGGDPISSTQVKKRKVWESCAKGLKTGDGGVATWDGKTIQTSAGPCSAKSLVGAPIS